MELCGSAFPADPHWRCYNEPPVDAEGWLLPTFEDARWRPATWAPRRSGVVEAPPAAVAAQFGRDARRFVLPAPSLDGEAEAAWKEWASAKESANEAWRRWRAAVEGNNKTNETGTADPVYAASMRGGSGGGSTSGLANSSHSSSARPSNSSISVTNNNITASLKWKDHAPKNATLERLEWHKPVPSSVHSHYCRLVFPNPVRAYQTLGLGP